MLEGHVRELFPAGHTSGYVLQIRADPGVGGLYVDGEHSSHWSAPPRCSTVGQAPAASGYMCTEVPDGYALWDKRSRLALN